MIIMYRGPENPDMVDMKSSYSDAFLCLWDAGSFNQPLVYARDF